MRIAYVIVRYGPDIHGGAEQGARMLAEGLAARAGWSVDVYTTCAIESTTWADEMTPGTSDINGVSVHRYKSVSGRDPGFDAFSGPIMRDPARASRADQLRWFELQGPVCPGAVDAAAASPADLVIFYPYLYWPTVHGVPAVGDRAVMHPAAHDEQELRIPLFKEVFGGVSGLVFQTEVERRLTEHLFPEVISTPHLHLGLGVDEQPGDPTAFLRTWHLEDTPFVLYVGRVDDGKGCSLLARLFRTYKMRRRGPLKLVMAGHVVNPPPAHPDIIVTGDVDEAAKWGALRSALALVHPSAHEAFSIVLMEAWTAGLPVMVNGRCAAMVENVRRSRAGLIFSDYAHFEVSLDRLVSQPELRAEMGRVGRSYVQSHFGWEGLLDRYTAFLERVGSTASRPHSTTVGES